MTMDWETKFAVVAAAFIPLMAAVAIGMSVHEMFLSGRPVIWRALMMVPLAGCAALGVVGVLIIREIFQDARREE